MSGCDAVAKSNFSPVLARKTLNENDEASYVNLSCSACGFMFGSEGHGKSDSGTRVCLTRLGQTTTNQIDSDLSLDGKGRLRTHPSRISPWS